MSKSKNKYVYLITILFVLLAAAAITTIIALKKQGNQPKKVEYTAVSAEKIYDGYFCEIKPTYDQSADAKQKLEDMFSYLTEFEKKVSSICLIPKFQRSITAQEYRQWRYRMKLTNY